MSRPQVHELKCPSAPTGNVLILPARVVNDQHPDASTHDCISRATAVNNRQVVMVMPGRDTLEAPPGLLLPQRWRS